MSSRLAVALIGAFAFSLAAGACGPTRTPCQYVTCNSSSVCDESTGLCVKALNDGGADAGADAGADGGADAGLDAGTCATACPAPSVCDPVSGACVECLTDLSCACPTPVCSTAHVCAALPVDGGLANPGSETCGGAPALRLCGASVHFTVDLSNATDDSTSSCGAPDGGGRDRAWTLVLDATNDVKVTAKAPFGSAAQPLVSLRKGCDPAAELACVDGLGSVASVRLKSLPPGRYPLIVDTCAAPRAIAFEPGQMSKAFTIDTSVASDDTAGSCNTFADSPEVVYSLTLGAARTVTLEARAAPGSNTDPVLYLREGSCQPPLSRDGGTLPNELGCRDAPVGQVDTLTQRLGPGTYFIFVEGFAGAAGPTEVTVTLAP